MAFLKASPGTTVHWTTHTKHITFLIFTLAAFNTFINLPSAIALVVRDSKAYNAHLASERNASAHFDPRGPWYSHGTRHWDDCGGYCRPVGEAGLFLGPAVLVLLLNIIDLALLLRFVSISHLLVRVSDDLIETLG